MWWGLTGPEFLALYWAALGATVVVGVVLIAWSRSAPPRGPGGLDPYGIALLSGGWRRVGHTALAGLTARGQVHVSRSGGVTPVPGARPADPFEATVLAGVGARHRGLDFPTLPGSPAAVDLRRRMAEAGYLRRPERAERAGKLGWVFLILLGLGLARLITGLMNDRPVGFLVLTLIATVVAWVVVASLIHSGSRSVKPTPRGHEALSEARRTHARGGGGGVALAAGAAILLPVAFAGLVAYPDPDVSQAFTEEQQMGAGSGSSDSGSSGGDGGSSCGGGSGCGGCGGCG